MGLLFFLERVLGSIVSPSITFFSPEPLPRGALEGTEEEEVVVVRGWGVVSLSRQAVR
jgi:hypothetical protein